VNLRGGGGSVGSVTISREPPRQREIEGLLQALDRYLAELYPAESNHLLSLQALEAPEVRFFVARAAGRAVGCGALRVDRAGYGEVKRMFVDPAARGQRIGRQILAHLEAEALGLGLERLRLETGISQPEALGLYRSMGFREREPFADYGPDPLSLFMEKELIAQRDR
jgi:putative acetyltransferase